MNTRTIMYVFVLYIIYDIFIKIDILTNFNT
jgi:hypothetical protein